MDRIILKLAMPILFAVIFILTGTAGQVQAKNVGASVNGHGNLVMDGYPADIFVSCAGIPQWRC